MLYNFAAGNKPDDTKDEKQYHKKKIYGLKLLALKVASLCKRTLMHPVAAPLLRMITLGGIVYVNLISFQWNGIWAR